MTHRAEEGPFDPPTLWQRLAVRFWSWWFRHFVRIDEPQMPSPRVNQWKRLVDEVVARGDGNVSELVRYLVVRTLPEGEHQDRRESELFDFSEDEIAQGGSGFLRNQLLAIVSDDNEWAAFMQDVKSQRAVALLLLGDQDDWTLYNGEDR